MSQASDEGGYRIAPEGVYVPLSRGYQALIDPEDLPRVSRHSWHSANMAMKGEKPRVYARSGTGRTLHRFIMNAPRGVHVDHINHDTLDNRRSNLRLASNQQNSMNREGANPTSRIGVRGVSTHKTNADTLLYVFRCHGKTCRVTKYFPHTDEGLEMANRYAEAHHQGKALPPEQERKALPWERKRREPLKLSDDDVRAIRAARAKGVKCAALAEHYGVTLGLVSSIARRTYRAAVPDEA